MLLFKSCHFTTLCLRKTEESTVSRLFYIYTAILPEIDMSSRHASNFWSSSLCATIKPTRLLLWLSSHTQHWLVCVDDWLFSFCKFPPQFVNILLYILLRGKGCYWYQCNLQKVNYSTKFYWLIIRDKMIVCCCCCCCCAWKGMMLIPVCK